MILFYFNFKVQRDFQGQNLYYAFVFTSSLAYYYKIVILTSKVIGEGIKINWS